MSGRTWKGGDSQAMAYASPYYGDRNFMMKAQSKSLSSILQSSLAASHSEGLFFGLW